MTKRLELEEALEKWLPYIEKTATETIPLHLARDRYLAEDICSTMDQPPFNRSAVDGYALKAEDIKEATKENPITLTLSDTVYAGSVPHIALNHGQTIHITTGAPIPACATCVMMQEHVKINEDSIVVTRPLKETINICPQGEDYKKGHTLLEKGSKLEAAALGLIASTGIAQVKVYKQPRVCLLNTGSELTNPGEANTAAHIYNSNGYHIRALIEQCGGICIASKIVVDDQASLSEAIQLAVKEADLVVTTGGVSVGNKDLMPIVLNQLGAETVFHRLALKPGTPVLGAEYENTPILALSGNPLAAYVTFMLIGYPAIHSMMSEQTVPYRRVQAELAQAFPKKSPTRRFMAGQFTAGKNGHVQITTIGGIQGSGRLCGVLNCEALIDIPAGSPPIEAGQLVDVILL